MHASAQVRLREKSAERARIDLDGVWRFRFEDGPWRDAVVPGPWAAQFQDLKERSGTALYERELSVPDAWRGRQLVLRFGAISYYCEVSLNGEVIGHNEGGYLPFEVILPAHLINGRNLLSVKVVQPAADNRRHPEFPFAEIPHGKQSWYGQLGGIWQSVALEARDPRHIAQLAVKSDFDSGRLSIDVQVSDGCQDVLACLDLFGPDGEHVLSQSDAITGPAIGLHAKVPRRQPWHPETPNLYTARLSLRDGDEEIDVVEKTFGFRKIEARDGKLWLNGQPFYMRGALDQDYYPDGISVPPSTAFLEDQLQKAKALGLNLLRCHIKIPDPRYYEVADRLGMLIWTEIPNVAHLSTRAAERIRETMQGVLRRDGHHPSIVIWTIINEDWGTRLAENADHRNWLKAEIDWLKNADPTRLVVDNSPCHGNFHVKTDINDYHYYRSVPERRAEWDQLTREFADGADWTFSPHGDAERTGTEPLIVSEFGVWGLPDPQQLKSAEGREPGWFESGPGWGDGAAYPHGIETRFDTYHLGAVFGPFSRFIEAVQWYQFENLKYQIESMRAEKSIQGFVITELTDVHWEANGLLDLNRNPRIFHDRFETIAGDVVIVPLIDRYAGYAGQTLSIGLRVASGGHSLDAGEVRVTCDGRPVETIALPATSGLDVADLGAIAFALPETGEAQVLTVRFELIVSGDTLTTNTATLYVYPRRRAETAIAVHAPDLALARHLSALGYAIASREDAAVTVVHALDADDIERLNAGSRYLVLADGSVQTHRNLRTDPPPREQPFMPVVDDTPGVPRGPEGQLPNIALQSRQGSMWRGDWIANFSWIGRNGAFARLPGGPLIDLSYDRVVPHHVMTGFRPWEYDGLVHGALAVGWLHKPAVTIAERAVGKGRLIATTFRLLGSAPGEDPVADTLLDAMIETISGR